MNQDYEKRLESRIDRELKALPELQAPAALIGRVMSRIATRAPQPWYRQSWQMWPVGLRTTALVMLLLMFGGICFAIWLVPQVEPAAVLTRKVSDVFGSATALLNAAAAVAGAVKLAVRQLGTGLIVGGLAMAALAYAMCLSLGTVYLRLAFARR